VIYCLEPLSPVETPVINTVARPPRMVDRIGSPALRTMLDVSAASQAETNPFTLLARFLASGHIAHVQLNDRNRRGPGQGDTTRPLCCACCARPATAAGWPWNPSTTCPTGPAARRISAGHVRGLWRPLP
jgi:D-psicose/D-tagatose/L-ribulose 3-epimerase